MEKTKRQMDELYEQVCPYTSGMTGLTERDKMKVLHAKVASEEATAHQVVKTKSAFSCESSFLRLVGV